MRTWGDADGNNVVNISDVQLAILGFQGLYFDSIPSRTKPKVDIAGLSPCSPEQIVNFVDVQQFLLSFKGLQYNPDVLNIAGECDVPCP